jgi:hypothetical protein
VGAVREVEASDIQPGADELEEELRRAAGGSEGGDNFGATGAFQLRKRDLERHGFLRGERSGVH